jgi:hypothetical protein
MALQADGRSPDIVEGDPDPMVKIHVDFLDEELHTSRTAHTHTDGTLLIIFYSLGDQPLSAFIDIHLTYANAKSVYIILDGTKRYTSRTRYLHFGGLRKVVVLFVRSQKDRVLWSVDCGASDEDSDFL